MNAKLPLIKKGESGNISFSPRVQAQNHVLMYLFFAGVVIFFFVMASRLFQLTIVKGAYYHNLSEDNRIKEVTIEAQRGRITDRKGYVLAENEPAEIQEGVERIESNRTYRNPEPFAHVLGYRQIADDQDLENDVCFSKLKPGDTVGKKGVEQLFDCHLRGKNGTKLVEVNAQGEDVGTLHVVEPEPGQDVQLSIDGDLQQRAYQMLEDKKGVVVAINPQNGEVLSLVSRPSFDPQVFEDNQAEQVSDLFADENRPMFNRATEGTYPPGSVFKMVVAAAALEEEVIERGDTVYDSGKVELGDREFGTWNYLEYGQTEGEVDVIESLQRSNDIFYYKTAEEMGPEKIKKWAELFGYQAPTGIGISEQEGTIPSPFWKEDTIGEQWYTGDTYNISIGQGYVLSTPLQVAFATVPFANGERFCRPILVKSENGVGVETECWPVEIGDETMAIVREGMHLACQPGGTAWPLFNFTVVDPRGTMPEEAQADGGTTGDDEGAAGSDGSELSAEERDADEGREENDSSEPEAKPTRVPGPTEMPVAELFDEDFLSASSPAYLRGQPTQQIDLGCKTGTAESGGDNEPHAWFTVFAPYEDPEILITVLVENGGQGSDVAAPIARELLRLYFERSE